jgi:hypothetical protein
MEMTEIYNHTDGPISVDGRIYASSKSSYKFASKRPIMVVTYKGKSHTIPKGDNLYKFGVSDSGSVSFFRDNEQIVIRKGEYIESNDDKCVVVGLGDGLVIFDIYCDSEGTGTVYARNYSDANYGYFLIILIIVLLCVATIIIIATHRTKP